MTATRTSPVGISVEQLAVAWARQERAAAGSTVVLGHEISGRLRLGIPWQAPSTDALACATILRPNGLAPESEEVFWIVALAAAAAASATRPGWPDLLFAEDGRQVGAVNLDVQLGPGRIESVVVSLRIDLGSLHHRAGAHPMRRDEVVEAFASHALRLGALADDRCADLLEEYAGVSAVIGRRVRARLLPRGETRGTAVAVDPLGLLVLESPTGMLERLSPRTVLRVEPA